MGAETFLDVDRATPEVGIGRTIVAGGPRVGGTRTDVRLSREGTRGRGRTGSRFSTPDCLEAVLLFSDTAGLRLGSCWTRSSEETPMPVVVGGQGQLNRL